MNFIKNLTGYSKISIKTEYLLHPNFPHLDEMKLLSGVMCIKDTSEHIMVRNRYEKQISALNHSILPKDDQQDGETFVMFTTDIDLEKVPEDFSHIVTTLMMFNRQRIPYEELLDCLITVTDHKDNIIFYHEFPGSYRKINCITILDIFRDGNYWSLRPICKNILNVSNYLLFGKH